MSYSNSWNWDPLMWSLFGYPPEADIIPNFNVTVDGWIMGNGVTGNNTFFNTQWTTCQYPCSGGYQATARGLFYGLIVVSLVARKIDWLASVAVGLVMTYSSTAAVHALVLVVVSNRMVSHKAFENQNWEIVMVEGTPWKREIDWNATTDLWAPIVPTVIDTDANPVLSIVCTAFLVFLPAQIWSRTLRISSYRPIMTLWGLLLLVGSISAMVNKTLQMRWDFDQLRFCPAGRNDSLPITNIGPDPYAEPWMVGDWYRWNRIIGDSFVFHNSTLELSTICLYPCFDFRWPLRSPNNIVVMPVDPRLDGFYSNPSLRILFSGYILIIFTGLSGIALTLITNFSSADAWENTKILPLNRKMRTLWYKKNLSKTRKVIGTLFLLWILFVSLYSFVFSLPIILFFVGYWEWVMWGGQVSDDFKVVGQWGTIVNASLLFGVAIILYGIDKWRRWKACLENLRTLGLQLYELRHLESAVGTDHEGSHVA